MSDLERFRHLPSAVLSDCLRGMHTLDSSIRNMIPGLGLAGPAFTVLAEAGSIITVHKALLEAPAGAVLVVGGETARDLNGALFGRLMAIQARLRDILGLVVDGPVRDVAGLREMRFPVFARCTAPRVGVNRTVGQTQVPTPCGGIIVNPGDYVRGDDDGITVIPAALVEQVIAAAEKRLHKEAEYVQRMQDGEHISDLIGFTELIYGEKMVSV
jgi:4-hydroxy-4-methyl-2-oxoglutarate aldolase